MSNEQQARKMFTSITKSTGGFDFAVEYNTACCAFLSGRDPSMPSQALIQPNKLNIDRLLKVTGGSFDPSKTLHRLRIAIARPPPAPAGEGGRVAREPQRVLVPPALAPAPVPDPAALAPAPAAQAFTQAV
jgi:hypothetical protein